MSRKRISGWICTSLLALAGPAPLFAQTAAESSVQGAQSAQVQAYREQKAALASEEEALMAQGATGAQIEAWHQQNAARFAALAQAAQNLSASALTTAPAAEPTRPDALAQASLEALGSSRPSGSLRQELEATNTPVTLQN
jgi:hypothetical protein